MNGNSATYDAHSLIKAPQWHAIHFGSWKAHMKAKAWGDKMSEILRYFQMLNGNEESP